jgi:hypothetical protein
VNKIPIDFIPGSHGNYLETVCNAEFGITKKESNFNKLGSSHKKSLEYQKTKLFDARHWYEFYPQELLLYPIVISIQFEKEDLLMLSSISLLRAADINIDNNYLEINTVAKLSNPYYNDVLADIKQAYPFVDLSTNHIPRNVLREYFKFGFRDPEVNGYWRKQQKMVYQANQTVIPFRFASFYNINQFANEIKTVADHLNFNFNFTDEFYQTHEKFLSLNQYTNHQQQCDTIVNAVKNHTHIDIPPLSLFQESYINACLENIYRVEMPFHQDKYFSSTKDVLYYIEHMAPTL